jgi:salicylate hydroxylase
MLPYLAQGANSALEDGAVLGLLVGHIKSKEQLPQALRLYEKLRKVRGDAIVKEAFKQVSQRSSMVPVIWLYESPESELTEDIMKHSDMISTCLMGLSSRRVMNSSCPCWVKSSRGRSRADGSAPKFNHGFTDTTRGKR